MKPGSVEMKLGQCARAECEIIAHVKCIYTTPTHAAWAKGRKK